MGIFDWSRKSREDRIRVALNKQAAENRAQLTAFVEEIVDRKIEELKNSIEWHIGIYPS